MLHSSHRSTFKNQKCGILQEPSTEFNLFNYDKSKWQNKPQRELQNVITSEAFLPMDAVSLQVRN